MKKAVLGVILGVLTLGLSTLGFSDDALVASKAGGKYHLATCPIAKQIKADNKVSFATPEDALKAGYTPCKVCNPPTKSAVTAALVGSKSSNIYHKPTCRMVSNIKADNKVSFASQADAEKAGYKPCSVCFPPAKGDTKKS